MNSTEYDSTILFIRSSALVFIFTIGCFLQLKIIKAVKEEKAMTWDINLTHSFVMIFNFVFTILLDTISYIFPTFKMVFGTWFCNFLLFMRCYGSSAITYHSLFISVYKCVMIVHHDGIRRFGMQKMKRLLFWANIIIPGFISFSYIIRPNNRFFNDVHRCETYQDTDTSNVKINETFGDMANRVFFCGLTKRDTNNPLDEYIYIVTKVYCFLQTIVLALVALNILEIFIYMRIFRYMQR